MFSNYSHRPHGCQGSSSAALLELVELISSAAAPVSELPVTSSPTDSANHCVDSSVRLVGDLLVYAVADDSCLRSPEVCYSIILPFFSASFLRQIQAHLEFLYETAQRLSQKIDGGSDTRRLWSENLIKVGSSF